MMFGPNISGGFGTSKSAGRQVYGAFNVDSALNGADGSQDSGVQYSFDAARCSAVYGTVETVQPSALRCLACIKV